MIEISFKQKILFMAFLSLVEIGMAVTIEPGIDTFENILDKLRTDIEKLKDNFYLNRMLLEDLQGFLSVTGIGNEGFSDPCGGSEDSDDEDAWRQLTASTCIKVLNGTQTMESAMLSCRNEFQRGYDIDYPRVLTVDSPEKQTAITQRLESVPDLSAIWIHSENPMKISVSNYSSGSPSSVPDLECIEIRSDSGRVLGGWPGVSCSRNNSVICEKTVSIPYAQLVQEQVNLLPAFAELGAKQVQIQESIESLKLEISANTTVGCTMTEDKFITEFTRLEQKIEQTAAENVDLRHMLVEMKKNGAQEEAKMNRMESEVENLRAKFEGIESHDCQGILKSLNSKVEAQEALIEVLQGTNQELEGKVNTLMTSAHEMENRLISTELRITNLLIEIEIENELRKKYLPVAESKNKSPEKRTEKPLSQFNYRISGWNHGVGHR